MHWIGIITADTIVPFPVSVLKRVSLHNHDAAVRAAIVYSLFSSRKAHDVDVRSQLEDTLRRIPTEKSIDQLLPCNWQVLPQ